MNSLPNKVAIIGSVGIPAKYGGFETLVEYLSRYLSDKIDLHVYCSSKSYTEKQKFYGKTRLHYIPLNANGIQSIPYDIFSIFHSLFSANTILILGVSGCLVLPIIKLFTKKKLIVNIDGLEWKRDKWGKLAKRFLKFSEKLAVKYAHVVVADNAEIQRYVKATYGKDAVLIPYGGDHAKLQKLTSETESLYSFIGSPFALKVCRIEPENNIAMILEAFSKIDNLALVMIGNWENSTFGREMRARFAKYSHIYLLDPIYDQNILNEIRSSCKVYIHGHSAGGTNPSLVEAMYLGLPIISFDIHYNRNTLENEGLYFKHSKELSTIIKNLSEIHLAKISSSIYSVAKEKYTWESIANSYHQLFSTP